MNGRIKGAHIPATALALVLGLAVGSNAAAQMAPVPAPQARSNGAQDVKAAQPVPGGPAPRRPHRHHRRPAHVGIGA